MIHCYKLFGYNIVLDVASGSVHSVDDLAYDVILAYKETGGGIDRGELIKSVILRHAGVSASDVFELLDDIDALKNRGKLFSSDSYVKSAKSGNDSPLSALCLNVSHLCNMSCIYCFAGNRVKPEAAVDTVFYLDDSKHKDAEQRAAAREASEHEGGSHVCPPSDEWLMNLETGKYAIDFLVASSGFRKNLDVDFFGGEPLLNWDVVKGVVKYAREIERKTDKRFRFTLTTNALLIDDDVINFTNKEIHNVVLSMDGRPSVHDAMRKQPGGGGSYRDVVANIKKLVSARRGKGYYIRGTFTGENKDFVNDILHIADLGFRELSMEPVVSKHAESYGFEHGDLPELFAQYETLAVEMLNREKSGNGFNFYHYNLDFAEGPCVHKRIAGCGVGTEYLAVTPSGELYPCHQFVGDKRFLMGDVRRGIANNDLRNEFSQCNIYSRKECRDCWARFYCSGGCAANAFYDSGSIGGVYKFGCELFKKRIECAIMMNVARQTQRPAP